MYACRTPTLNDEVNHPLRKLRIGIEYLLRRSGPMSMGASQVYAFTRTRPELETPDIQFHFQPLSSDRPGHGLHRYSAFTASVTQLRPESRGSIRIRSPDPYAYPAIRANYLSAPLDRDTAIAGLRVTRAIAATRAMAPHVVDELLPGSRARTDEELLGAARRIAQTIYHPVGTCRMGQDRSAVVDARLRVHGLGGLRVVDASIMPAITSGNTNAPAIMIGEKASDLVREDSKP